MGAKSLFTSKSAGKAPLRKAARKHTEIFRRKNTFSAKECKRLGQAGSKCRQLEVGARRAPRLLVYHMYSREVTTEHGKWKPPGGRK